MIYPEIEPFAHGMLEVGDENVIYWEMCGNPRGKPALVVHGGPGSGCSIGMRRFFDPAVYRIVLFDQRGCGRSTPSASDPNTDLSVNTTHHLLADMERLRRHLDIERWLLLGLSWGCTLGLAYAEQRPRHVSELILVGVTMTRRSEIDWLYRGVAPLFPAQWARFLNGAPPSERAGDLVESYHRLLEDPEADVRARAARDFTEWEVALMSLDPNAKPGEQWSAPAFQLGRARIVTHYFRHNAWLEDGSLLRQAGALAGIPGVMVQGRLDLGSPMVTAWELAQVWPAGELVIVEGAGHTTSAAGMTEAVLAATDRFRGLER